jgi:hypothetical protein
MKAFFDSRIFRMWVFLLVFDFMIQIIKFALEFKGFIFFAVIGGFILQNNLSSKLFKTIKTKLKSSKKDFAIGYENFRLGNKVEKKAKNTVEVNLYEFLNIETETQRADLYLKAKENGFDKGFDSWLKEHDLTAWEEAQVKKREQMEWLKVNSNLTYQLNLKENI